MLNKYRHKHFSKCFEKKKKPKHKQQKHGAHVLNWILKQRFMFKRGVVTAQSQGGTGESGFNKYTKKKKE